MNTNCVLFAEEDVTESLEFPTAPNAPAPVVLDPDCDTDRVIFPDIMTPIYWGEN